MKTAWKLCLALALMVAALFVVSVPAFAAGTHTVSGTVAKPEGMEGLNVDGLTFKLYKVGGFGRDTDGKATLVLDERIPVDDSALVIDKDSYTDEAAWQEAWAVQARTIALYLDLIPDAEVSTSPQQTSEDGQFSFASVDNGLYLLVNSDEPQIIDDMGQDGQFNVWTPQPMLVMVLNNDVDLGIKWDKELIVNKYTVNKQWEPKDSDKITHPSKVEVEIYYDFIDGEDNQDKLVDTQTLDSSNDWTYKWNRKDYKDTIKEKGGDPYKCTFTVVEKLTSQIERYYEVLIDPKEPVKDQQTIFITNTYDARKLKIEKIMPSFWDHFGEYDPVISTSFVFEITGKDKDDQVVYHNIVGLQVEKGQYSNLVTVAEDIPRTITSIEVEEKYAGAYTPKKAVIEGSIPDDDEEDDSFVFEDDTLKFKFENEYKKTPIYSGGVINRFTKNPSDGTYSYDQIGLFQKKK